MCFTAFACPVPPCKAWVRGANSGKAGGSEAFPSTVASSPQNYGGVTENW